jgi:hypothetical protein
VGRYTAMAEDIANQMRRGKKIQTANALSFYFFPDLPADDWRDSSPFITRRQQT